VWEQSVQAVNHADTGLIPHQRATDTSPAQARSTSPTSGPEIEKDIIMNKIARTTVTTVTVLAMSGLVASGAQAGTRDGRPVAPGCHLSQQEVADWGETSTHLAQACDQDAYTVLDHPSLRCHLSQADVANWGETSAHLPLACTYGE
jgi:hypothetical protein